MHDAAAIVRRLTAAQKRALLWLPADGQPRLGWPAQSSTIAALSRLQLVARWRTAPSVETAIRNMGKPNVYDRETPHCIHDAYSLTHRGWRASVRRDGASGVDVRTLLEQEAGNASA